MTKKFLNICESTIIEKLYCDYCGFEISSPTNNFYPSGFEYKCKNCGHNFTTNIYFPKITKINKKEMELK
jgi:transposase-like protein